MIAVRRISEADHYSKTLQGRVTKFNAEIDKLAAREASVPVNLTNLAERVLAGEVGGVDAIQEREHIRRDAEAVQIDQAKLYHEKQTFAADIAKAHRQEAEKHKAMAEARRAEMEKQLSGIGRPVDRETLIRSDATYRAATDRVKALTEMASRGMYAAEERDWFQAFTMHVKRQHGIAVPTTINR